MFTMTRAWTKWLYMADAVGAGANMYEFGRFEIADGFSNVLQVHAGPWGAGWPGRQSSI
jgi:hypothetical protein